MRNPAHAHAIGADLALKIHCGRLAFGRRVRRGDYLGDLPVLQPVKQPIQFEFLGTNSFERI